MRLYILLLLIFVNVQFPVAQTNMNNARELKEGIYLNFLQVKNNSPVPKIQIRTNLDYNDINFFDELAEEEHITFYDNLGNSQTVQTNQIWGYCNRGSIYINIHNQFVRIPVLGSISHFSATYTYTDYQSPYQYSSYYDRYYNTQQNKTELRQYLLDFETGKIYDFHYKSMEALLANDPDLLEEYTKLSRRKQKKLKFFYLRKYNDKHPLTFDNQ